MLPALIPIAIGLVPELVKWVAGDKAGKVADVVSTVATSVFGTDDPAQISAQIGLDPNKKIEFQVALARIAADEARSEREEETKRMIAAIADVQSARVQTLELAKAGSPIAWGTVVVSCMSIALAAFAVLLPRWFPEVGSAMSESDKSMLLVAAISWVAIVQNYWLGSSRGSATKDAALSALAKKQT